MKNIKLYITAAFLCALSLAGCSINKSENSLTADNISVSETTTSKVSETTAQTETCTETSEEPAEIRNYPDFSEIKKRPSEPVYDVISYIPAEVFCSVKDSYYQINGLSDTDFQEQINSDIKNAMDSLRNFYTSDYSEYASRTHSAEIMAADGIVADIICRNGFLSVMLEYGYYPSRMVKCSDFYTVLPFIDGGMYYDHVITLNYELTTRTKITDFSDLFYEDADWETTVRTSEDYVNSNGVPFYPDEKPELFTIDYIFEETEAGYAAALYNDSTLPISQSSEMISSGYCDMSSVSEYAQKEVCDMFSVNTLRTCESCGEVYRYTQISTSRFFDQDKINSLNADLEQLYSHGFPGRDGHECNTLRSSAESGEILIPEYNIKKYGINLWAYRYKNMQTVYYDPETFERVSLSAVLSGDWRSNASCEDSELPDLSSSEPDILTGLYNENGTVHALFLYNYSDPSSSEIEISVPAEMVNEKFLAHSE